MIGDIIYYIVFGGLVAYIVYGVYDISTEAYKAFVQKKKQKRKE